MQSAETCETLSVIIPTKNEGELLEECLNSIRSQSVRASEIIIVDGGSTDNTLEIAQKFGANIIKEQAFSSPANARNLGAEKASGEILLIMDADVVLGQDCLKNALKIFEEKTVIGVLPSEQNVDDSYIELLQRKWNEGSRTGISIGFRRTKTSGLVAFFRKEVLEKVKFDTKYGFGEDDDFSNRIEQEFKDCKMVVAENCTVISHSPHTFKEFAARYSWWGRTFLAYLSKHFGIKSILNMGSLLLPLFVLFASFLFILLPQTFPLLITFLVMFFGKLLIVCYRSKSLLFFQFAAFDMARSIFFSAGLVQSLFQRKKGR